MLGRQVQTLASAAIALAACLVSAESRCDRHGLEAAASRLLTTLSTGNLGWLQTVLAENATYSENLVPMQIGSRNSTLARKLRVDYSRTTVDTTECATFTEIVAADPRDPWMLATQLRFGNSNSSGHGAESKVVAIDSIATTNGDFLFNATHALHYYLLDRADWTRTIPASQRTSRTALKAAVDAYYNVFINKNITVPWGTPCTRVEGGYLSTNGTCDTDIPDVDVGTKNKHYVIDEEVGSVNVIANFGILGPDSHEFHIMDGKIRSIHAMTLCRPNPDCGLAIPDLLKQDIGF